MWVFRYDTQLFITKSVNIPTPAKLASGPCLFICLPRILDELKSLPQVSHLKTPLCCGSSYVSVGYKASRTATYSLASCTRDPHFPCASGCALSAGMATWTPCHIPVLRTWSPRLPPVHSSIFTLEERNIIHDTGIFQNTTVHHVLGPHRPFELIFHITEY
jgi:hypothetical protein